MRLLFDANLSPKLVSRLAELFPNSLHVFDTGFGQFVSDETIGITPEPMIWRSSRLIRTSLNSLKHEARHRRSSSSKTAPTRPTSSRNFSGGTRYGLRNWNIRYNRRSSFAERCEGRPRAEPRLRPDYPRDLRAGGWCILNASVPRAHVPPAIVRILENGVDEAIGWLRAMFSEQEIRRVLRSCQHRNKTTAPVPVL